MHSADTEPPRNINTPPAKPGSGSRVMTLKALSALKKSGAGSGRGEKYTPWIRVRRRFTSPVSNLHVFPTPLYGSRSLHLLSGLEHHAALLALWLGATEIREQFPMWPHEHPHPAVGLNFRLDRRLGSVRGLLDVARDAGIDHGTYPATQIPFVATSDLLLRLGQVPNDRLVFWACKPYELLHTGKRAKRVKERLMLENLYAESVGAQSFVIHDTHFEGNALAPNLGWVMPTHSELLAEGQSPQLFDYALRLDDLSKACPLRIAIQASGKAVGADETRSQMLFRLSAWLGLIDIDLREPVLMTRLMKRGGRNVRHEFSIQHLGTTE